MQEDLEYTRKWKVSANVKNYAVVNPVNPVTFKRKWGEDELPIADQYTNVAWRGYLKIMFLG